jgi:exonuclease III
MLSAIDRYIMTLTQPRRSYRIARRAGNQGARSAAVPVLATVFEKSATEPNQRLLKCKRTITISTFNVRTLSKISQISELVASAATYNIDIICIQEHRFFHQDIDLEYHDAGSGWTFISASAWKNSMNSTIGGVGMLLSPLALKSLNSIEKIRPRLIIATFNGNPCTTVISCYSPTNVSDEVQVPKHNVLMIGDMNVKLGQNKDHKFAYHQSTNRNGQHFQNLITENGLFCLNTHFQKKCGKLWTHTYPNGVKAQLDYMLVNRKWINSVINCEAYSTFEGVSSDHRIVSARIRLSLRANKPKAARSPRYDWSTLVSNDDIQNRYTTTVRNRFDILQLKTDHHTPNSTYDNFVTAHNEAAVDCIPLKPKVKRRVPWETVAVLKQRDQLKSVAKLKNLNPIKSNISKFKKAQKDLAEIYNLEQRNYVLTQIDKIAHASTNKQSSMAWQTVNEVSGRKTSSKSKLKASSEQERLFKWKEHFQNLLGKAPVVSDRPIETIIDHKLNIKLGNFTLNELTLVLKKLKKGKAAGLDDVPPEAWKMEEFNGILLDSCNAVYNQNPIDKWTEGCILPFPKKGDLGVAANYRGITLTAIAAKVYNTLLLNRIQPVLDPILRKNQNGFRKNRSTVGQILTVRRVIEGIRAKNLEAVMLFVDFSKAFDSVHRGKMEQILRAYEIPQETVNAIMMLYKNTHAKVRSPDGDTDFFDIIAGVLQGDTLAPFLFIVCLDYVLRTSVDKAKHLGFTLTKSRSRRHPAITITDADYADDLALMSDTITEAQSLLHSLETAAGDIGLYVNAGKTEFISYNQAGSINTINGKALKSVNSFTYLGSNISSTEADVKMRIGKAWGALNGLNVVWKSSLPDDIKRDFFQAAVETVLVYGSSTWTLTKKLEAKLDGTYTRMLRAILNISWK